MEEKLPHKVDIEPEAAPENAKKAGEAGGSGGEDGGIKCKYMRAAQGFLGNTTFHGISWVLEEVSAWAKLAIVAYFTFMFICALYSVITAVVDFYPVRPQKVSVSRVTESPLQYPKLTLCSPAFFSKARLAEYGLDDAEDSVANFLILSLQNDQMSPALQKTEADYQGMEARVQASLAAHNVTYLQLLRRLAITCDEFILFVREKRYSPDMAQWPRKCGEVFSELPILTGFGTCFILNPSYSISASAAGFTERMTLLLSTHVEIYKDAAWLNDEALRSGVLFSLSSMDHHVNSLAVGSQLLSPGTTNLIAMTKKRVDRSGFSEDQSSYLSRGQACRERGDTKDVTESSIPFSGYNHAYCQRKAVIQAYEEQHGCSLLALFGTTDLVTSRPVCRREVMQNMMPVIRQTVAQAAATEAEADCPLACVEEDIATDISFTLVSEESHNRAWKLWQLPANRTKEDAVFMELFYKSLDTEVTKFDPVTVMDLLSSIGGSLGLFLGGSIFSLFEFTLVLGFFLTSMMNLVFKFSVPAE